ncbi:MAG: response regulator transcription factor [Magnetovibrio sp.]|nr:response regulator transcription factor [Magnetovibrio sp.]
MKILLAEDDAETGEYIRVGLTGEGYSVDHVTDGREALTQATLQDYDMYILDRMMPGLDGLSLLKALRAAQMDAPAIFLTAVGGIDDKVDGLRSGADDYIVKPFSMAELSARVAAIFRRPMLKPEITELIFGELRLNLLSREAHRGDARIDLQPREFILLKYFMERPGRVQTKTMLLEAIWDVHFDPKTSVVETHVSRLRAKIDKPFEAQYLRTLHGVGYILQL